VSTLVAMLVGVLKITPILKCYYAGNARRDACSNDHSETRGYKVLTIPTIRLEASRPKALNATPS